MNLADFRYWHKADIGSRRVDVRYWGQSGHPAVQLIVRRRHSGCGFMLPRSDRGRTAPVLSVRQPNDAVCPRGTYGDKARPSASNGLAALLRGDAALACSNRLANPCQRSPTPLRSISQPAFITCVCEGTHKLVAFQSNLQGFLLDPCISPRRAGIHSGSS